MTKTVPLTVENVRQFALPTGADFVVLLAYFDKPGHTQYLTWGRDPEGKVAASDLSEEISAWINAGGCKSMLPSGEPATVIESFKLDAAKNKAEVDRLRDAIRQHRDERGDDRCHADDGRLYAVLPEGDTRPERETAVTLENCAKYIECRQTGREYVSPQRRIEELEAAYKRAVDTCPQSVQMPKPLQEWWARVYRDFISAGDGKQSPDEPRVT